MLPDTIPRKCLNAGFKQFGAYSIDIKDYSNKIRAMGMWDFGCAIFGIGKSSRSGHEGQGGGPRPNDHEGGFGHIKDLRFMEIFLPLVV